MTAIVKVTGLTKTYDSGFSALNGVDLSIEEGEILALLGPNGAGKTTLISSICGITRPTSGTVTVGGFDILKEYRKARSMIGLVPQELALDPWTKVRDSVAFSRGLYGRPPDPARVEYLLKSLALWEKADEPQMALSGGMKRRLLIAKALAHGPRVLFLDEPTAGVDVELREQMWELVDGLRKDGVTIILTTHYIEEAEEMADRVAVIDKGRIRLIEGKKELMARMGRKRLVIELSEPVAELPAALAAQGVELMEGGRSLSFSYQPSGGRTGITRLLNEISAAGMMMTDLSTEQSSLQEIFVGLVHQGETGEAA